MLTIRTNKLILILKKGDNMEDILYKEIGNLIKDARLLRGYTQQGLSETINLTRASVANIERGTQKISIYTLYQIAEILKVSPHSLLPEPEKLKTPQSFLYAQLEDVQSQLSPEEIEWFNQIRKVNKIRERDDDENKEND